VVGVIDLIGDSKKRNKVMLLFLVLGLIVFGIASSCGVYESDAENILERPGMMIVFSFVGCWVLIILAKLIMTPLLQRSENYYEERGDDTDA
jgi:hypothetical protein